MCRCPPKIIFSNTTGPHRTLEATVSKDRGQSREERPPKDRPQGVCNVPLGASAGQGCILMATPLTKEKDRKHRGTPVPRATGMALGDRRGSRAAHSRGHGEGTSFLFFSFYQEPRSNPSRGWRQNEIHLTGKKLLLRGRRGSSKARQHILCER